MIWEYKNPVHNTVYYKLDFRGTYLAHNSVFAGTTTEGNVYIKKLPTAMISESNCATLKNILEHQIENLQSQALNKRTLKWHF